MAKQEKQEPQQKQQKNPFINTKPEISNDPPGTRSARTLTAKKAVLTVEHFELALLEARKISIGPKTSNHALGQLCRRKDALGAQARAERTRRQKAKPPKKRAAYAQLAKDLQAGRSHAKRAQAIANALRHGDPRRIANIIARSAEETRKSRSRKHHDSKVAKDAVKAERARARQAARKRKGRKGRKGGPRNPPMPDIWWDDEGNRHQYDAVATKANRSNVNANPKAGKAKASLHPTNPAPKQSRSILGRAAAAAARVAAIPGDAIDHLVNGNPEERERQRQRALRRMR